MSNEIVRIEKIQTGEIMSIAKAFYESGMFTDIKSAAQAVVKIQAGQEIGIPPFASMSGIHIIQGKPTIGAGLIASRIKGSGKYDYQVNEQTEKICSIDFYQGKKMIGNSTFTIEDAKKAVTKNIDKFPRNMLFARAISNGVKWYCPDVFVGPVYTPEEFDIIPPKTEDVTHENVMPTDNKAKDFYESWQTEINAMDTATKLRELYDTHAATVSEDEKLKLMFKTKQATFKLVKS